MSQTTTRHSDNHVAEVTASVALSIAKLGRLVHGLVKGWINLLVGKLDLHDWLAALSSHTDCSPDDVLFRYGRVDRRYTDVDAPEWVYPRAALFQHGNL